MFGTRAQVELVTLLGSCITACIRDPIAEIGGMNHYMIPGGHTNDTDPAGDHRYAQSALDVLISSLIARGATMERLEVKLFGGGNMLETGNGPGIGEQNIAFAEQYFADVGLTLLAKDVGKHCPRKVHYDPLSGTVQVKRLTPMYRNVIGLQIQSPSVSDAATPHL